MNKFLLLIILIGSAANADRQERFACVGDNGQECECIYDKRKTRLIVSCQKSEREYSRSFGREKAVVGSARSGYNGHYSKFGVAKRWSGDISRD